MIESSPAVQPVAMVPPSRPSSVPGVMDVVPSTHRLRTTDTPLPPPDVVGGAAAPAASSTVGKPGDTLVESQMVRRAASVAVPR